ncbi:MULTISPECIES: hypothetical protein [Lactobacillus]|jgi:hypothetical protein|uniref:Uncharacterized protein n=5 Tax=Lactobacillus TaxID=1578 RepID=A0A8H9F9G8_LACHE|nr:MULTISPECIES: hypothetical protein [Lactobacillus]ADX69905.1 Putative uncharacterized protein [Lactobacillus helveticus H10]EEJ72896.1 hypothetical protein HMPREF0548_0221 [Lactobacillus ultunensis DSM 16047]KRO15453.1 hypothetical protein IV62_GL001800 [Lactobacillus helveticus]MBW8061571.1 hypothetical protein [Lactobacillus helveticus]NRN73335.1 hypothetical protein [Lactobacillus helveticus]
MLDFFIRKGKKMLYPYIEFPNELIVTHSEIKKDNSVWINFEQPCKNGFREARIALPQYKWLFNEGFSDKKIKEFEQFSHQNAAMVYKYARLGGINNA